MKLSDRLERIAAKAAGVTEGYAADVGTDLYGAQHVFVQLETGGASGIGEVVCFEKAQANAFCAYLESMKDRILGQDELDLNRYIKQVIFKLSLVFGIAFFCIYNISTLMAPSFYRIACTYSLSIFLIPLIVWLIGLDHFERSFCIRLVRNKFHL